MTQRAAIIHDEAWLGKPFGEALARRIFGNEIVDALPRNIKGKWAGHLKPTLTFRKVQTGGWVRDGFDGVGHVERRVGRIISASLVVTPFRGEAQVLHSVDAGTGDGW